MALDIGKVGIVMKGDWSSSVSYEELDAVSYAGGLYIAKQPVPAGTAPTNTTYWQAASVPFSFGQFRTNAIAPGINVIDVTTYVPYAGTMPTNPSKCIAMLTDFANITDAGATLCGSGTKFVINATQNNDRVRVNWIQLNI